MLSLARYIINRLLLCALSRRPEDDRDHYGNKRLDLAGPLLGSLFRMVGWLFVYALKYYPYFEVNRLNICFLTIIFISLNAVVQKVDQGCERIRSEGSYSFSGSHFISCSIWGISTLTYFCACNSALIMEKMSTCNLQSKLKLSLVALSTLLLLATGGKQMLLAQGLAFRKYDLSSFPCILSFTFKFVCISIRAQHVRYIF